MKVRSQYSEYQWRFNLCKSQRVFQSLLHCIDWVWDASHTTQVACKPNVSKLAEVCISNPNVLKQKTPLNHLFARHYHFKVKVHTSENIHVLFSLLAKWQKAPTTIIRISENHGKQISVKTAQMNEWVKLTVQQTVPALSVNSESACCSPVKTLCSERTRCLVAS